MGNPLIDRDKKSLQKDAERLWYLALCFACLLVIASAGVTIASTRPGFCSSCHASQAKALAKSRHAAMSCDKCHTRRTLAGVLDSRLSAVGMIPAQIVPGERVMTARVSNEECLVCHSPLLREVVVAKGIRMSHKAVEEAHVPCAKCHPGAGHGVAKGRLGYTMEICLTCHTPSSSDLKLCSTCHLKESPLGEKRAGISTPWRITHGPNWRQTHGMGNLNTCKSCHQQGFCSSCHNMDVPHVPSFSAKHGATVLARANGAKDCYVCHRQNACINCHGISMPHPKAFMKIHPKIVKSYGETVCLRCHTKKTCDECHTGHLHRGVPSDVLKKLQETPVR